MKKVLGIMMIALVSFTAACSKKGSSSATAPITYHLDNGNCINSNNQQVDYSYCNNLNNSGYYWNQNNQCCNSSGGAVDATYCNNINNNYNHNCNSGNCNYQNGGACRGKFYYVDPTYGDIYKVRCDGIANYGNCSGYELISMQNGQTYYCM